MTSHQLHQFTTSSTSPAVAGTANCEPADRMTRSLLGYGVIAGPIYVTVSLAQAMTRDGFDLARHQWSLLANGGLGWIQIANFVVTGLMVIAFSVGLRRELKPGVGARWAPRLIGAYGAGLVAAGAFRADPALGFPAGTPEGPGSVSWHGLLHLLSGGVGFVCLAVGCFVMAWRFSDEGRRRWARLSRLTGVVLLAGFAMVAASGGAQVANMSFTAAVLLVWSWLSAIAVNRYRLV